MFGRVISGDNVQEQGAANNSQAVEHNNGNSPAGAAMVVEPDQEYSDHDAPLELIAPPERSSSDTFTTSSSLSDASQEGDNKQPVDVDMDDVVVEGSPTPLAGVGSGPHLNQHPLAHYQQHLQEQHRAARMERMDSSDDSDSGDARATTSQNSSRDWGWFEDVHQSGQITPTGSLTNRKPVGKDRSGSKSKNKHIRLDAKDGTIHS